MATVLAVVIIVVILVAGGLGTYLALPAGSSGSNTTKNTVTTCEPLNSPKCVVGPSVATHNAVVSVAYAAVQEGQLVPISVGLPTGLIGSSYTYFFGNGVSETTATSTVSYAYTTPGTYYVYAVVTDASGAVHDNLGALAPVTVTGSFAADTLGNLVQTAGQVVANSTATSSASAVIRPGGAVTLGAWVSSPPTNPTTTVGTTYYVVNSTAPLTLGTASGTGGSPGSPLTVTVTASSSAAIGGYPVTFVVPTTLVSNGVTENAWSNYTFTVFVGSNAAGGGAAPIVHTYPSPPNRGTLNVYLLAPGGSASEDPAIDYETVGYEPIMNVYQTLISYNGSSAGPAVSDFVPNLATCVPGGSQCESLYHGNTLVSSTGNYTFVINPAAQFYDAATGAHYGVYPSDVVFSVARTCLFSTYPGYQVNPGWILCQSLLPNANVLNPVNVNSALAPNPNWDGGLHSPLNNTPGNILTAMTVNSSAYCPKVNGAFVGNGCVTFNTQALTGTGWSYFLELVADPLGASVMSCAWASANGGGIPGFSVVGDHCTVPAANSLAPTAWDSYMSMGATSNYNTYIQWHMMGSGPYYLANLQISRAYYLQANPYWGGTTCVGGAALGCFPGPYSSTNPTYIPTVNVVWETSQTQGEAAYVAGTADFATIPTTDTNFLLQLAAKGTIGIGAAPTLSIFFLPFNMDYNVAGAQSYITTPINTPGTMLQDLNFRQFLINSFPYATIQSTVYTVDGIQFEFPYGGAIPQYMGNFYPTNISWPTADPSSAPNVVGTAGYWWALFQQDPIYKALSTGNGCLAPGKGPCILPLIGQTGAPAYDIENTLFANEVFKLSGGKIEIVPKDLPFFTEVTNSFLPPGQNPQPIFNLGWAPDYPDPTDYMSPLYQPDSTYTFGDAVMEGLASSGVGGNLTMAGQYYGYGGATTTACANGGTLSAPNGWDMVVTLGCQGWAYVALTNLVTDGAACAPPACSLSERALIYNNAEQIAYKLGLYIYNFQESAVFTYASWISPAGLSTNPMIQGAEPSVASSDQPWYLVTYQNGGP